MTLAQKYEAMSQLSVEVIILKIGPEIKILQALL